MSNDNSDHLPLVLLPGTLCDETLWSPMLTHSVELEASAQSLFLEGRSVAEAIDRLSQRLPERFAVAGFSLGAIVALALARHMPERVEGLCLIAGNGRGVPPCDVPARRDAWCLAGDMGLSEYVKGFLWPRYVSKSASIDLSIQAHIVAMAEQTGMDRYADQIEIAINRCDSLSALAGLNFPTLIAGGEQDVINPAELQYELADALFGSWLLMVPNAGHFVPLEAPSALATAMETWLRVCTHRARIRDHKDHNDERTF